MTTGTDTTPPIQRRLRRIEGQIQGIQRMLDNGRACEDVLTQILAVRSGVEQVSLMLTEAHLRDCAARDVSQGPIDPNDDPSIAAFMDVLRLWVRAGAPGAPPTPDAVPMDPVPLDQRPSTQGATESGELA